MGSHLEQESPKRLVNVRDFYISKTEITVQQYMDCVRADICNPPHWDDQTCWMWDGYKWTYGVVSNVFRQDYMPITCISWHEAKKFAQWIGGDLPTEAQWEYAAKSGGKDHQYPWGNDEPSCQKLNYNYTCISATSPVCSTPQGNTLQGLCDMSGNVYEWVLDDWYENYQGAPNHELARCKSPTCEIKDDGMKLYRGGSWIHLSTYATTSFRYGDKASSKSLGLGFRIVKSIQK
jgi:formylglycine-generating enzyme required for sulfatase activity